MVTIRDYKVNILPSIGEPNSRYYVPQSNGTHIDEYITDKNGNFRKVNPITSYIHTQSIPEASWEIIHNLDYYPNVSIVDSSGSVVHGDIKYIDTNTIIATFSGAFSGVAYVS